MLWRILLPILAILIAYLLLLIVVNRFVPPQQFIRHAIRGPAALDPLQANELVLVSWNLGYAGLGKDSNFLIDGGTDLLPPSRRHVLENTRGITEQIGRLDADVYLFQELAGASFINRRVDLKSAVIQQLDSLQYVYSADLRTRVIPPPLSLDIGSAVFSRREIAAAEGRLLPLEGFMAGIVRKNYRLLVTRLDLAGGGQLVVVNVHLAAFDEDGAVRNKQLDEVRAFAENEYAQGRYVIVGGDWNLRLVDTDFPHTTSNEFLFWVVDLPPDAIPDNWTLAADDRAATVRTVHKAYEKGDNFTCVIDGFLLSPNIELLEVENIDVGFEHTDHQPVRLRLRLKTNVE